MKRKSTYEPCRPSSRTQNGYLSILIADSTWITLSQLADFIGLRVDSIVRAGIDLVIEQYGSGCFDVQKLMNRSARHHRADDPVLWGFGYHDMERKATLPKGTQSFKSIEVKASESKLTKEDLDWISKWPVVINPKLKNLFLVCENKRCGRKLSVDHVTLVTTAHVRRFCCVECIHEGQQAFHDYIAATVEREVKGSESK